MKYTFVCNATRADLNCIFGGHNGFYWTQGTERWASLTEDGYRKTSGRMICLGDLAILTCDDNMAFAFDNYWLQYADNR